jgi:hypothetical protein
LSHTLELKESTNTKKVANNEYFWDEIDYCEAAKMASILYTMARRLSMPDPGSHSLPLHILFVG